MKKKPCRAVRQKQSSKVMPPPGNNGGLAKCQAPPGLNGHVSAVRKEQWREWAAKARWELERFRRLAGVCRRVFYRDFKRVVGQSPQAWLTADRLRVAAEMLSTGLGAKEIFGNLGFKTPQAFCLSFKRHFGHTATEYLRRLAANRTSE